MGIRVKPVDLPDLVRAFGHLFWGLGWLLLGLHGLWTDSSHLLVLLKRLAQ